MRIFPGTVIRKQATLGGLERPVDRLGFCGGFDAEQYGEQVAAVAINLQRINRVSID